jgi:microcystin degradation protein MlrC
MPKRKQSKAPKAPVAPISGFPSSPAAALTETLALALTATTHARAAQASELAERIAVGMSETEVAACKRDALAMAQQETKWHVREAVSSAILEYVDRRMLGLASSDQELVLGHLIRELAERKERLP